MRATGLEPAHRRHQILNLTCLPISPRPQHDYSSRNKKDLKDITGILRTKEGIDMTFIRCENVHKIYGNGGNATHAVNGITASFDRGVFYSIIGRSGSGKSTFLYLLSGLLDFDEGEILYEDVALSTMSPRQKLQLKRSIGFIFQDYQLLPELTVKENIMLPCFLREENADEMWCDEIMEKLQISDLKDKYPDQLSGGQQQRTAIARAFMTRPSVLFCDEPTGNLDKKSGEDVLNLLLEIRELYNPTVILVTHDLDIARSADVILHIEDGRLVGEPL